MSDVLDLLLNPGGPLCPTVAPGWWATVPDGIRAPYPYFGGKSRAAKLIWSRLGSVVNYVEPFAGSLAVLLARPHEPRVETVNDVDGMLVNFWRATRNDPGAVASACDWPVHEADLHSRHRYLTRIKRVLAARLEADPFYFNPMIAGFWVWGLSAWIGSGWCSDRGVNSTQPPLIGGGSSDGSAYYGQGVHARSMRRMPMLGGAASGWQDEAHPHFGKGIHAAGMRRQIPDLGGGGEPGHATSAKGVHGVGMRRQMPDLGGVFHNERDEAYVNVGRGVHGGANRAALYDVFDGLARRMRYVRVTCGDFGRILTPAVTWKHGLTGVVLDPPYEGFDHLYGTESVSARVRAWCVENGARPDLRIALCGYDGEHTELEALGWTVEAWKAQGGYSNQGGDNKNARRERIWFSPACLTAEASAPAQLTLLA